LGLFQYIDNLGFATIKLFNYKAKSPYTIIPLGNINVRIGTTQNNS